MSHTCHWPGCPVEVEPQLWGCRTHWYRLPMAIRRDIWRYYRPGQEITKDPSDAYIGAARRAREWAFDQSQRPVQRSLWDDTGAALPDWRRLP